LITTELAVTVPKEPVIGKSVEYAATKYCDPKVLYIRGIYILLQHIF